MTTKFDIDDAILTIHENKVMGFTVVEITIFQGLVIRYKLRPSSHSPTSEFVYKYEEQVFATKDELLKSL